MYNSVGRNINLSPKVHLAAGSKAVKMVTHLRVIIGIT